MGLFNELETLGELMADNLTQQGVTASANDGLTTLASKILDIQGSSYHIEFTEYSYIAIGGTATVSIYLQEDYQPLANATVTFTSSASTSTTATTDSNGIATATISFSDSTTLTVTYQNVSDTAIVTIPTIPSQYTRVEYLQSNGSNGINTGYILQANDIVEVTFNSQATANYESIFGARKNNNDYNSYVLFCRFSYSHKMNYGRTRKEENGQIIQTNTKYTAITNQRVMTLYNADGTVNQTITNSTGTIEDCVNPCGLFTLNTYNGTGYQKDTQSHMKIYEFKITDENGTFKRHMLPVRNGTTGGMYDLVSEQFYGDASGVAFLYGGDV